MVKPKSTKTTWVVIEDLAGSGIIQLLNDREDIQVLTKSELRSEPDIVFTQNDKIIITTETVLDDVLNRLNDDSLKSMIENLKNKIACRQMLKSIFPDFYFEQVRLCDLHTIALNPDKKYFVKPVKGYWGSGCRLVEKDTDLATLAEEIRDELKVREKVFANSVLTQEEMIIEEFLDGEEYAVDMFYNEDGVPVITNICHHPLPDNLKYLHVLYYTSYQLYQKLHDRFIRFFTELNLLLKARSLPIHGEFKDHNGQFIPVELNPLRFGSDGFADLTFHAFGYNPFLGFAQNDAPDWEKLWSGKQDKFFAFFLGYNGTDIDMQNYRPDLRKFRQLFSKILTDNAMNYQKQLAFSVAYIEESSLEKIFGLLNVEFSDFFIHVKQYSRTTFHHLYQAGIKVQIAADETVWEKGDLGDYLLLLLAGEMEVFTNNKKGEEIILDRINSGNIIGEFSSLDGLPRSASVRTKKDCVAIRISGPAFRKLLSRVPDILEDLFWQQMNRVRKMDKLITE